MVSHTESMINNPAFDEARQWYVIECFGERWWARHTSLRRAGTGLQRFQHLGCGARLAVLTFPLTSFRSPTESGEGGTCGAG